MMRNHWKTNAGKIVPLAVLILATVATGEQIRVQAQQSPRTRVLSTRPTAPAPQGQAQTQVSPCRLPKSPECLEMRINELTNRTAALETDLNAIRNLLQRVDDVLTQHGQDKGDLAGTINDIWKAIGVIQDKVGIKH